ncbi:MAG: hypothetical protein A2289_09380 [Deltaproteobacteria bacterium RIFOXYA12_FULL_58_15]|nr:MAG: hypothetical protein A2289_09380 [Deltaproteobacteria bacterium RIFOXYA12_FULL_58_15]OGR12334.1 MAG: hypothetical protein A2341_06340 [Deltaproteobacteria bacterium RIFOXYB12_FULL_58_9]
MIAGDGAVTTAAIIRASATRLELLTDPVAAVIGRTLATIRWAILAGFVPVAGQVAADGMPILRVTDLDFGTHATIRWAFLTGFAFAAELVPTDDGWVAAAANRTTCWGGTLTAVLRAMERELTHFTFGATGFNVATLMQVGVGQPTSVVDSNIQIATARKGENREHACKQPRKSFRHRSLRLSSEIHELDQSKTRA